MKISMKHHWKNISKQFPERMWREIRKGTGNPEDICGKIHTEIFGRIHKGISIWFFAEIPRKCSEEIPEESLEKLK